MTLATALTSLAVLLLLLAEWRDFRPGVYLAKPLASCGFLLGAWAQGGFDRPYARALCTGLALCALGDVLLIRRGNGRAFLLGIASFALGHAAYAYAFAGRGGELAVGVVALAGMIVVAVAVLRWLGPHLPADMRLPVRGYLAVIAIMIAAASSASAATHDARLALGAAAFAISDLSVARERFVRPDLNNLLWGLPLYYAAQLVLASSLG